MDSWDKRIPDTAVFDQKAMKMQTATIRHWFDLACRSKKKEDPTRYLVAAAFAYMFLMACYWGPPLGQNETVYLLKSKRLASEGLLGPNGDAPWLDLTFMFNIVMTPFWWFTQEPLKVALAARALIWLPVVYSIARLARQLRVPPLFFVGGFFFWLIGERQNIGADEWILVSIEGKVCAYGFAFAALTDLMCNRVKRAAVFAGAAVLFHILVGGWFLMGLGIAMLADRRRFPFSQLVTFVLISGVLITPMIVPVLKYRSSTTPAVKTATAANPAAEAATATNSASDRLSADRKVVKISAPFHLNPDTVLSNEVVLQAAFMVIALFACFCMTMRDRGARLLIVFTCFLTSLWIIAFMAGKLQWYWLLKFYLFRVGDTVLPLLFWLCVPAWAFNTLLRHDSSSLAQKLMALTVWTIAMCMVGLGFPGVAVKKISNNLAHWRWPYDKELLAAFDWIRQSTNENDVILMNPCNLDLGFQLYTDRRVVVNYKYSSHNMKIVQWLERLQATNGGRPFQGEGFQMCKEININFPYLNQSHLRTIHEHYRARYYFVDRERPVLKPMLAFQKGKWHIYDLSQMPN